MRADSKSLSRNTQPGLLKVYVDNGNAGEQMSYTNGQTSPLVGRHDNDEASRMMTAERALQDATLSTLGLYRYQIAPCGGGDSLYRAAAVHLRLDQNQYAPALRRACDAWRRDHPSASRLNALAGVLGTGVAVIGKGDNGLIEVQHVTPPARFDGGVGGGGDGGGGGGVILSRLHGGHYDAVVRDKVAGSAKFTCPPLSSAEKPEAESPPQRCGAYLNVNIGSPTPSTSSSLSPQSSVHNGSVYSSTEKRRSGSYDKYEGNYISGTRQRAPSTEHRRKGEHSSRRASQPATVRVSTTERPGGQSFSRAQSVGNLTFAGAKRDRSRPSLIIPIRHNSISGSSFVSSASPSPRVARSCSPRARRPWGDASPRVTRVPINDLSYTDRHTTTSTRPLSERELNRRSRNATYKTECTTKPPRYTTVTSVDHVRRSVSVDNPTWSDGTPIKGANIADFLQSFAKDSLFEPGDLDNLLKDVHIN